MCCELLPAVQILRETRTLSESFISGVILSRGTYKYAAINTENNKYHSINRNIHHPIQYQNLAKVQQFILKKSGIGYCYHYTDHNVNAVRDCEWGKVALRLVSFVIKRHRNSTIQKQVIVPSKSDHATPKTHKNTIILKFGISNRSVYHFSLLYDH